MSGDPVASYLAARANLADLERELLTSSLDDPHLLDLISTAKAKYQEAHDAIGAALQSMGWPGIVRHGRFLILTTSHGEAGPSFIVINPGRDAQWNELPAAVQDLPITQAA